MKNKKIVGLNQKGGVGKTTTMKNTAYGLSSRGKKVLQIDFDPQMNLTLCSGFDEEMEFDITIADLMNKAIKDEELNQDVNSSILKVSETLHIIPGDIGLAQIEMLLPTAMDRNYALSSILDAIEEKYDYILIDCGPSLGLLTINALAAADSVMIITEASYLSIKGIDLLIETIIRIRKKINRSLKIEGVLITRVDGRLKSARKNIIKIKNSYEKHMKIFKAIIPERAKVKDSKENHQSIIEYAPESDGAVSYMALVEEIINE